MSKNINKPPVNTNPPHSKQKINLATAILIKILNKMQNCVRFVDRFTNFVIGKKESNDVVENARYPILFGIIILASFVLIGGLWSAIAPLDSASVAIGTVISDSRKKIINHERGGIIKEIYVSLGDKVKKGESLLEFDATQIKAEFEKTRNRYMRYLATESRIQAQLNKQDSIEYPDLLTKNSDKELVEKIIATQNDIFTYRNELQSKQEKLIEKKIEQLKKQIEGVEAKKFATQKNLDAAQEIFESKKVLHEKGHLQKSSLIESKVKLSDIESQILVLDTQIINSEHEISKEQINLINLDSNLLTSLLKELDDTRKALSESKENFTFYKNSLERIVLKSPADGIVNKLHYYTIGMVISAGQPIIEISPINDKLTIEAKIPPKNIDSVAIGLSCKIRFSAFKSRVSPVFRGDIVSLSPDIVIDQRAQMDPRLGGGYYVAKIEIDMEDFAKKAEPRGLRLQPGMQAEVQIVTGTRTLLRYLLDPLFDAMFKGLNEK